MTIRLGCVPEHFSAPLMYAMESDSLQGLKVDLMIKKLVSGDLDVAICVTEGLVAGIGNNKEASLGLFGTYVDSPLPWAASVKAGSRFSTLDDLGFGATFGISRLGSGSQVIAQYAASQYEWKEEPKFKIIGDVNGLVAGIENNEVDAFLWERTTMNKFYAQEKVMYLGTVRAPWPAFSFGARKEYVEQNREKIDQLLHAVGARVKGFMDCDEKVRQEFVCKGMGYAVDDYKAWLAYVVFNTDGGRVDRRNIANVVKALVRAGAMEECDVGEIIV
ncbi:hypothetical protein GGI20_001988 [Coemansia sp. BCRC 34301]|nr:hypothetical protein GGI20_001988 [Coemansia sp. BCRC 34301]